MTLLNCVRVCASSLPESRTALERTSPTRNSTVPSRTVTTDRLRRRFRSSRAATVFVSPAFVRSSSSISLRAVVKSALTSSKATCTILNWLAASSRAACTWSRSSMVSRSCSLAPSSCASCEARTFSLSARRSFFSCISSASLSASCKSLSRCASSTCCC